MERVATKVTLLLIALASAVYWAQPPHLTGGPILAVSSAVWAVVQLGSFRWDRAEDWGYRLGAFLGVAMATVEIVSGMLALQLRAGLVLMAVLHGTAFVLCLVGRYQKVGARRSHAF